MPERYAFGTARLRWVCLRGACNHLTIEIRGAEHMNVLAIVQMMAVEADEKECQGTFFNYVLTHRAR
jgi:hypothetical protein